MFLRKLLFGLGIVLISLAVVWFVMIYWNDSTMAKVINAYEQPDFVPTQTVVTPSVSAPIKYSVVKTELVETPVPTPTPIPEASYILGNLVDLSSGDPIALTIDLPDGGQLQTNWAGTLPYKGTDDLETVFAPDRGMVYSYLGDVVTTWAHSGRIGLQGFFATDLDLFLRKNPGNVTASLSEANAKAESLQGSTAYLCQVNSGSVNLLSDYNTLSPCPGKLLKLEIVAVIIVPREKVDEYNLSVLSIDQWLTENFPGAGFDQLSMNNGWIVSFCVGKLADQNSDGTPSYLYNRGVIGFQIIDGSS